MITSNVAPVFFFTNRFPVGSYASRNCKIFQLYNGFVISIDTPTASR